VNKWPDRQENCDRCQKRRWVVQVFTPGLVELCYCQKCIVGVLRDRPDARYFRCRLDGWTPDVVVSRQWLQRALAGEPLR
jgi:hypothetical protein